LRNERLIKQTVIQFCQVFGWHTGRTWVLCFSLLCHRSFLVFLESISCRRLSWSQTPGSFSSLWG